MLKLGKPGGDRVRVERRHPAAASESIVQQVRELNSSVTDDGDVSAQGAGSGRGMPVGAGGRQAGRQSGGKGAPMPRAAS
jgi:hypothetical protein